MSLIHFKTNFHVETLDFEQVVLFSEDRHHLLQGSVYVAIAELVKYTPLSELDIIKNLCVRFPVELIKEALHRLKIKNFITESCSDIPKNIVAFWSDLFLEMSLDDQLFFLCILSSFLMVGFN